MIGKINRIGKLGGLNFYKNINSQHQNMIGRYSTKGKTNDDIDRSIIKDLSNNNNDLTVKNITWNSKNGSGYGGFNITPNDMIIDPLYAKISEDNSNKIIIFNFEGNASYIKIPTTFVGQITRFEIIGASYESTFEIGSTAPFPIIQDGIYTYENKYEDVISDMSDSDGYIRISHYGQNPSKEVTIEFFYEYPNFLVIPKLSTIECSTLNLNNDFTIISNIRYINNEEYYLKGDDNFITIRGTSNLINFKYGDLDGLSQKIQLGTQSNIFQIPYTTEKYIINTSLFNDRNMTGKETIINDIKNMIIIGGNNCRIAFKDLLLYNKSLSNEEIKQEIKKYNL